MMKIQEIKGSFTHGLPIFINRCGYFALWFIIFKQGISIYLNFFILCMLTFIFYNF